MHTVELITTGPAGDVLRLMPADTVDSAVCDERAALRSEGFAYYAISSRVADSPEPDTNEQPEPLDLAKLARRHDRERKSRLKHKTFWAGCCGRLYSKDARPVAYWQTCLACKKPLTYGREIPTDKPASPSVSISPAHPDLFQS